MKMKIVVLMLVAMVAATQANILYNGDFESVSGPSDGWSLYYGGGTGTTYASFSNVGGTHGWVLNIHSTYWGEYLGMDSIMSATPGDYTISYDIWSTSTANETYIDVEFYDASEVQLINHSVSMSIVFDTGGVWENRTMSEDGVNPYVFTAPEGTVKMDWWIWGVDSQYDNIVMVPEPMTMGLLGLGALMLRRRKRA